MKIFDIEEKDGLSDLLKNRSIAYLSKATTSKSPIPIDINLIDSTKANANPGQFDLYYLDSILVSTGWNLNDDVFDKEETWKAKTTPVDKAFNYMHNEADIIGHITSASIIVGDEIYTGDDIPDEFHILEGSVLYKVWNDTKLKERMDTLISEIEEGKWYVSMECLFSNFDYAMVSPKGEQSIVKGTKTTAYLTKHLRAYGGTGSYDGYKVGRLLRNITFSGKGLVDEPANPNSIIFNGQDVKTLTKSFRAEASSKNWEKKMNEEVLKAQAEKLSQELNELKAEKSKLEAEVRAKAEKEVADKVAGLEKTISELSEQLKCKDTDLESKNGVIEAHAKEVVEVKTKLDEALKEVNILKASIKKAERVAQLTKAGVADDKHEGLLTKFDNISDDVFAEFVTLYANKEVKTEKVDEKAEAKKVEKEVAEGAEQALETAKAEKAPTSTSEETDTVKEMRTSATNWLGNTLKSTAKNIRKVSQEASNAK